MMHTQSLLQCSRCQVMLIDDIMMVIYLYQYLFITCTCINILSVYCFFILVQFISYFIFFFNYYMYFRRKYFDCAINEWICSKLGNNLVENDLSDSCHNFYCIEWNWIMKSLWKKSYLIIEYKKDHADGNAGRYLVQAQNVIKNVY